MARSLERGELECARLFGQLQGVTCTRSGANVPRYHEPRDERRVIECLCHGVKLIIHENEFHM